MDWSAKLDQTYDEDAKTRLSGILNEMDRYYEKRDSIAPSSVIITKSHEFDGTLMNVCNKRIVLTSSRDSEEVFDSGLNLGWFMYPKEESRETFDKYYALWNGWKSCWESAAENDLNSVLFDLDYSQLTTEGSFRAVVMQMTYEIAQLLNLQEGDVIPLETRFGEPAVVPVMGKPKFTAQLGRIGNRLGARIADVTGDKAQP